MDRRLDLKRTVDEWGALGTVLVAIDDYTPSQQIDTLEAAIAHVQAPARPTEPSPNEDRLGPVCIPLETYRRVTHTLREVQTLSMGSGEALQYKQTVREAVEIILQMLEG